MAEGRFAIRCDASGRILEVIRDDLELVPELETDTMFPALGTDEGSVRCFEMLAALREQLAVFGWLVELNSPLGTVGMYFAGVYRLDQMLLVASQDPADVPSFTDELSRLNNEHVNSLRALLKEKAQLVRAQEIFPQMTELNNANTALQRDVLQKQEELNRLVHEKNELLGIAAHDIRNPLTVIQGVLEILPTIAPVSERQTRLLADAQAAVQLMVNIIDGVLDTSTVESGVLSLELSIRDIEPIVARAVAMQAMAAQDADIQLDFVASGVAMVSCDEVRLYQVLQNLIANAIEYSPAGASLRVELGVEGDEVCIAVVDQGPGVPAEEREQIFQPFRRGAQSAQGGVGLGLAIARRIVRAHGGSLELAASSDAGSRFELRLPLVSGRAIA